MKGQAVAAALGAALMIGVSTTWHAGAASSATVDWPQEGFNAQHTGDNPGETTIGRANAGDLTRVFQRGVSAQPDPIEAGGVIYLSASADGTVQAINAGTGAIEWTRNACNTGEVTSIPAFADNKIWVGLDDPGAGVLSTSGTKVACIDTADLYLAPPTVQGGVVYAGGQNGEVIAISASSEQLLWRTCIHCTASGGPVLDSPAVSADGRFLFIGSSSSGYVYKLNAQNGKLVWSHYVDSCGASAVSVSGSSLFVSGCNLYALAASTGAVLWHSTHFGSSISAPAVAGGLVFAAAGGNYVGVAAFNESTGAMVWNALGYQGPTLVTPTVANGVVYVDDGELSSIIMLNSATGSQIGSIQAQYPLTFSGVPIVVNGHLYVCASNLRNGSTLLDAYAPQS